jgi:hypothetical protein
MDEATFDALVRSSVTANPRRMGYADLRPDIRPLSRLGGGNADHASGRLHYVNMGGGDGKSVAAFAGSLRAGLYDPSLDARAPRSGAEFEASWGGTTVAPSDAGPGYAFRHAAALSAWTGAGSVYDRLTDHRGYTGVHRARFDADGQGRGMAGRDLSYDVKAVSASIPGPGQGAPALMDNQLAAFAPR